jgi:hypothetical protein
MGLDRAGADVKAATNFLVAETLGDPDQDFALAIGQIGRVGALPVAANHLVERNASDLGAEEWLASVYRFDGLNEFLGRCLFEDKALGAYAGAAQHEVAVELQGEEQDFDLRQFAVEGLGDGQAGQTGHVNVSQEDVWEEFPGFEQYFLAVGGFADDLQVRVGFQAGNDTVANDGVVVGQEHPDLLAGGAPGNARAWLGVYAIDRGACGRSKCPWFHASMLTMGCCFGVAGGEEWCWRKTVAGWRRMRDQAGYNAQE